MTLSLERCCYIIAPNLEEVSLNIYLHKAFNVHKIELILEKPIVSY